MIKTKLKDFNYLISNFYTIDSSTMIREDELNGEELMKKEKAIDTAEKFDKKLKAVGDIEFIFVHKVIDLVDRTCGAVFNGKNTVAAKTAVNRFENVFKTSAVND